MSDEKVTVYVSSTSGQHEMRSNTSKAEVVLKHNQIDHEFVDVCGNKEKLTEMRDIVGDPKAVAIQFCKGSRYLGDFAKFEEAVEAGTVKDFCT